jgi:hypothetical protein
LTTTEQYNPRTGLWTILPGKMIIGVSFAAFGVIGGRLYVAGGNAGYTRGGVSKVTQMFEPTSNTWVQKKDMPSARAQAASAVVKGRLYVVGGLNDRYVARASVFVYDPLKDKWQEWDSSPKVTKPADQVKRGETAKELRLRTQIEEGYVDPHKSKRKEAEERKKAIKAKKIKEQKKTERKEKLDAAGEDESESEAGGNRSEEEKEVSSSSEEDTKMVPRAERLVNGELVVGVRRGGDAAATAAGGLVLAGEVPALSYNLRTGWQELPGLPDRTQPIVAEVALFTDFASKR